MTPRTPGRAGAHAQGPRRRRRTAAAPSRPCRPAPARPRTFAEPGGAAPGWTPWRHGARQRPGSPAAAPTPTRRPRRRHHRRPPAASSPTSTAARPRPYRAEIRLRTLPDDDWDALPRRGGRPPRPHRRAARQGRCRTRWPTRRPDGSCRAARRPRPRLLLPRPRPPLQARRRALLPDGPTAGRGPVRPAAAARPRRTANSSTTWPGATPRAPPASARHGPRHCPRSPAREALAPRTLPPCPPPFPAPAHPGRPPVYPHASGAPDPLALDLLATEAAARAHTFLTRGIDPIAGLTPWQDAVRLAAAHPGSGLAASTRALYVRSPRAPAARPPTWPAPSPPGARAASRAWTSWKTEWDPPAGPFDRARPALIAADFPHFRP